MDIGIINQPFFAFYWHMLQDNTKILMDGKDIWIIKKEGDTDKLQGYIWRFIDGKYEEE